MSYQAQEEGADPGARQHKGRALGGRSLFEKQNRLKGVLWGHLFLWQDGEPQAGPSPGGSSCPARWGSGLPAVGW